MRLSEQLEEATARRLDEVTYKVGTVRPRSDGDYMKIAAGKWERMPAVRTKAVPVGRPDPTSDKELTTEEKSQLSATVRALASVVKNGKVIKIEGGDGSTKSLEKHRLADGMTQGDHLREAKGLHDQHKASIKKFLGDLDKVAPNASTIRGRNKTLESMLGKLVRQPHNYKRTADLQDVTGAQVVLGSSKEVADTVAKIRKRYKVIEEKDRIKKPQGSGYRSHHMIVEGDDGLPKEIQVRTKNQDDWASWSHNSFKPLNKRQRFLVKKYAKQISAYALQAADHLDDLDHGRKPRAPMPDCPPEVNAAMGCVGKS